MRVNAMRLRRAATVPAGASDNVTRPRCVPAPGYIVAAARARARSCRRLPHPLMCARVAPSSPSPSRPRAAQHLRPCRWWRHRRCRRFGARGCAPVLAPAASAGCLHGLLHAPPAAGRPVLYQSPTGQPHALHHTCNASHCNSSAHYTHPAAGSGNSLFNNGVFNNGLFDRLFNNGIYGPNAVAAARAAAFATAGNGYGAPRPHYLCCVCVSC